MPRSLRTRGIEGAWFLRQRRRHLRLGRSAVRDRNGVSVRNARRMLVEDVAAYEQAIRDAAPGEAVEYEHIAKQRLESNQRLMAAVDFVGAVVDAAGARSGRSATAQAHGRRAKQRTGTTPQGMPALRRHGGNVLVMLRYVSTTLCRRHS